MVVIDAEKQFVDANVESDFTLSAVPSMPSMKGISRYYIGLWADPRKPYWCYGARGGVQAVGIIFFCHLF